MANELEKVVYIATNIIKDIIYDLSGRSGLEDEWELIDDDIKNEISSEWMSIVFRYLNQTHLSTDEWLARLKDGNGSDS